MNLNGSIQYHTLKGRGPMKGGNMSIRQANLITELNSENSSTKIYEDFQEPSKSKSSFSNLSTLENDDSTKIQEFILRKVCKFGQQNYITASFGKKCLRV